MNDPACIIWVTDWIHDWMWISDVRLGFQTMKAEIWRALTRLLMLLLLTRSQSLIIRHALIYSPVTAVELFPNRSHVSWCWMKSLCKRSTWSECKRKKTCTQTQPEWEEVTLHIQWVAHAPRCHLLSGSDEECPQAHRQGPNHNQEIIIIHSNHKWRRAKWLKLNSGLLPLTAGILL